MGDAEYEIIVIPKGTLLFRGMKSVSTLTSDFAGVRKASTNDFCLNKNYNVFFYPFPFVADAVSGEYKYITVFITARDLKLVNLILPSKFVRSDRDKSQGGVITCSKIEMKCGVKGYIYDPCIDFNVVSSDVSGMIGIAKTDAEKLRDMKNTFKNWNGKYFTSYKDARGLVGVPEIVLHPLQNNVEKTETITDFQSWYKKNKHTFNYKYLHILDNQPEKIEEFMEELLSDYGMNLGDETPYFLKMNKKNGLFQIQELSDTTSDLVSIDLRLKSTDMVLKRKDIYKEKSIKKEYTPANTIPSSVLQILIKVNVNKKGDSYMIIGLKSGAYHFLEKYSNNNVLHGHYIMEDANSYAYRDNTYVFNISGHYYALGLTPKGREINKTLQGDMGYRNDHPIAHEVSAYEVVPHPIKALTFIMVNKTPARDINGILKYFAEKNGLSGGSHRRTLRRRLFRS